MFFFKLFCKEIFDFKTSISVFSGVYLGMHIFFNKTWILQATKGFVKRFHVMFSPSKKLQNIWVCLSQKLNKFTSLS